MTIETVDADPLEFVRQRLKEMPASDQARIALAAATSSRTVYNIIKGERDAKYGTVMALHKAIKDADAAAAGAGA
jgi:hypothetical protein